MSFDYKFYRRLYEAARKDSTPGRFTDQLQEDFKSGLKADDLSLRELFEAFVPHGTEALKLLDTRQAGGYQLREALDAVDTTAFSNITGQLIYNAMLEGFNGEDFIFSRLVTTVQTSFNGEKIPGIGGLKSGLVESVNEGMPYPIAGLNEDWIETPQTVKRGLIVPVTREAIFFDRTGMVIEKAREVGEVLGMNKENRIIDAFIDENVTTHRLKWRGTVYATYQSATPWINLVASNPLVDFTNVDTAEQTFQNMIDLNTGEPITVTAKHLVCCRDLRISAMRATSMLGVETAVGGYATSGNLNRTKMANPIENDYTIVTSRRLKARMATDTSWFIGDVSKAVKYMQNFPLAVEQASKDSEKSFERDIVAQFKASERGAAAVVNAQAVVKCTA